jgi:hypothetical protein
MLKEFDVKEERQGNDNDLDDDEKSLLALVEDIEQEELTTVQEAGDNNGGTGGDDDLEGWVDEIVALSPAKWVSFKKSIPPVK